MAVRCETVLQAVRDLCPPRFALEGDATGLQVGHPGREVERVLCALDLTLAVAEEARDLGAGLVVSHHAVIFRPLRHLRTDDFKGRILETLIKHDVAVYVPHTAMDVVAGGMNDHLAASVGLRDPRPLEETGRDPAELLVFPPPPEGLDAMRADLLDRGALEVASHGERVEAVVPARRTASCSRLLEKRLGHPPRVVPLASHGASRGIGRIGRLARPEALQDLAARLKQQLAAPGVRLVAADPAAQVSKVAVLGGDGRRFLSAAVFAGAEALVTGDVDHHTALEARARGLALIDVGHWASERQVSELLASGLRERLAEQPVEILASEVDTQPFRFV